MDEFFATGTHIDIYDKPVNIDPESFHKPEDMDRFTIPESNQNISLRYKRSVLQPTKIYLKVGAVDTTEPFLIQLNQTFGMSWKLKWITQEEFEEKSCADAYQEFAITQNKYCNYRAQILDIRDTKFLSKTAVPESQHFEGNFVGNTWLVTPGDIPPEYQGKNELYAVVIYEKQIWYNWALIISGTTLGVLIILSLRE